MIFIRYIIQVAYLYRFRAIDSSTVDSESVNIAVDELMPVRIYPSNALPVSNRMNAPFRSKSMLENSPDLTIPITLYRLIFKAGSGAMARASFGSALTG